jgi:lipoate-protein ligase A
MFIKQLNSKNIFFNLATEEYLLKNKEHDFVLLYANESCIVVGKHQNAMAEINHLACEKEGIPIARRISGGGTVYHDLQNLNFAFLLTVGNNPVNFRKYSAPIVDFLNNLGIAAEFSPRNDIFIGDKKISGNAEHVFKHRVLHHGTLLFNSSLEKLNSVLNVRLEKYQSKAVQSVRRNVANISDFLSEPLTFEKFSLLLLNYLKNHHQAKEYSLSESDFREIDALVQKKYQSMDWNYGYSPKYQYKNSFIFDNQDISINFDVEKGIIKNIKTNAPNSRLEALYLLENTWHLPTKISEILNKTYDTQTTRFLVDNLV